MTRRRLRTWTVQLSSPASWSLEQKSENGFGLIPPKSSLAGPNRDQVRHTLRAISGLTRMSNSHMGNTLHQCPHTASCRCESPHTSPKTRDTIFRQTQHPDRRNQTGSARSWKQLATETPMEHSTPTPNINTP